MKQFPLYFDFGFYHIVNFDARDHILFLLVLLIIYSIKDVVQLLAVITSFTLAHTLSLVLATFNIISVSNIIVEIAIASTILITALENIFWAKSKKHRLILSSLFGLIHGLGFSVYLKSLLGAESSIIWSLLGFNLGVELGQICIVALMAFFLWCFSQFFKIRKKTLIILCSTLVLIQSSIWIALRMELISINNIPRVLKFLTI